MYARDTRDDCISKKKSVIIEKVFGPATERREWTADFPNSSSDRAKAFALLFLYFIFVLENQMSALEETQTWPRTSLSLGTQQAAADLH